MDDNLMELAKGLVNCWEEAYEVYKIEVDNIITYQIKDINYIERTLDYILDIYTEKGFYLFLKLLIYYRTVNLENALEYLEILKEYRMEEYDQFVKKYHK